MLTIVRLIFSFFGVNKWTCVHAQSCPSLCNPMNCSPPGSSIHGILQLRILEWVAMPSFRGSSWLKNRTPPLLHCRRLSLDHWGHISHEVFMSPSSSIIWDGPLIFIFTVSETLKRTIHFFCRMSLNLGLSEVSFIKLVFCIWGKNMQKWLCPFRASYQEVGDGDMSHADHVNFDHFLLAFFTVKLLLFP